MAGNESGDEEGEIREDYGEEDRGEHHACLRCRCRWRNCVPDNRMNSKCI